MAYSVLYQTFTSNSYGESFLSNKKWVEELCQEGKFIDACTRAKQMGSEGDSYSNLWKAFDYLGVFVTKESK